jgi:hypothetical protein
VRLRGTAKLVQTSFQDDDEMEDVMKVVFCLDITVREGHRGWR